MPFKIISSDTSLVSQSVKPYILNVLAPTPTGLPSSLSELDLILCILASVGATQVGISSVTLAPSQISVGTSTADFDARPNLLTTL